MRTVQDKVPASEQGVDNDEVISDIFKPLEVSSTMGKGMISGFFSKIKSKL